MHDPGDRRRRRGQPAAADAAGASSTCAPTGACVGRDVPGRLGVVGHRHLGAGRPGRAPAPPSFSVQDAQGRRTNAERDGRLLLDLQGYPAGAGERRADRLTPTASSRSASIPGEARPAYPALTGFVIRSDGAGRGALRARTAPARRSRRPTASSAPTRPFAVNAVGESRASVRTVAWAYDPPRGAGVRRGRAGRHRRRGRRRRARDRRASTPDRDGHRRGHEPDGRDRAGSGRSARDRAHRAAGVPRRIEHVDPDHRHAVLALRAPAGSRRQRVRGRDDDLGERHRRAAATRSLTLSVGSRTATAPSTVTATRLGALERRRLRRCATASCATATACATAADGGDARRSPGSPTARSTASRSASSPGSTATSFGAVDHDGERAGRAVRSARRRAGPSPWTARRTSPTVVPSGSSATQPVFERARAEPATTSSSPAGASHDLRPRPRHPGPLRPRPLGHGDAVGA